MMAKVADAYLQVDPWKICEEGFHPDKALVSESLFSLANEHQGVRGYFEEGYSAERLVGAYVNGIYEERLAAEPVGYKGISNRLCYMVNTVDWLSCTLRLDGQRLDLATSQFSDFRRELDFRTGELTRSLVWHSAEGKQLRVVFRRLLSMATPELALQQIELTPLNFSGDVAVTLSLDFGVAHQMMGESVWQVACHSDNALLGVSKQIGQRLFAGMEVDVPAEISAEIDLPRLHHHLILPLTHQQPSTLTKKVILATNRDPQQPTDQLWAQGQQLLQAHSPSYDALLADNRADWDRFWTSADISIDGDLETQQGIRFCLFQLHQTYRGAVAGANIGAKGLTGEVYNGNAFWDTETYCLPFFLFSQPDAAKALIDFRYRTLPQARERARELDCDGACYPVATIDGTESCTLWQHASLQIQPTTAVAYAIEHYVNVSDDRAFLAAAGGEMLVDICRFLASRGQWSPSGDFGYYAVMGPDEFQMMVNHNAYTNYMAKRTFEYTLAVLDEVDGSQWGVVSAEIDAWRQMADRMLILYDAESQLFEQHEGFFNLPHLDIGAIPVEDFPLYHNWSYDRIYRNDMIKQPDVLMFLFLYNQSFTAAQKAANYAYYEPRCIHESSLSPSVHSILALELGRDREGFEFFRFATRIDLDNYNRNSGEGIHTTSIAAAWMNIVYGFGGMRSDGPRLAFRPCIPAHWTRYRFHLVYREAVVQVTVTQDDATFRLLEGDPVTVDIFDLPVTLTTAPTTLPLTRSAEFAATTLPQGSHELEN